MIATVSEDATCKVWPSYKLQGKNKVVETLKGHTGKNIRSLACLNGLIATGGDDGAVKIQNVK